MFRTPLILSTSGKIIKWRKSTRNVKRAKSSWFTKEKCSQHELQNITLCCVWNVLSSLLKHCPMPGTYCLQHWLISKAWDAMGLFMVHLLYLHGHFQWKWVDFSFISIFLHSFLYLNALASPISSSSPLENICRTCKMKVTFGCCENVKKKVSGLSLL